MMMEAISKSGYLLVFSFYNDPMIESALQSAFISISVTCISRCGHIPNADNAVVVNAVGMMIPVNGIAMRFVRMKYWGNVPKYNQARGPVVS